MPRLPPRLVGLVRKGLARPFDITPWGATLLLRRRAFVTRRTQLSEIRELVRSLHPVAAEGSPLIRLGSAGDGGYLVPDDLRGMHACFSPGVGRRSAFEKDCADLGMTVFLADGSVDAPTVDHERFKFIKQYVGAFSDEHFITMDDWVAGSTEDPASDLLLQMDIEGAEYEVLLNTSDRLIRRCRIIVVEFHGLTQLWSEPFFRIASRVFRKLLTSHACVHIHPNNSVEYSRRREIDIPDPMEFTFLRRDRLRNPSFATRFPHPLDSDTFDRPPVVLPAAWYRSP